MTRYHVVRNISLGPQDALPNVERHPGQPEDGFASKTEGELFIIEHFLAPHRWVVEPFAGRTE